MQESASSNVHYFMGVGLYLTAWWMAPGESGAHGLWYVMATLFSLFGLLAVMQGVRSAVPQPSPFPSLAGRILWALRPRAWLIAWAVIWIGATMYGTPHMLWLYPADGRPGVCAYVGADGIKREGADGGGLFGGCSLIALIR